MFVILVKPQIDMLRAYFDRKVQPFVGNTEWGVVLWTKGVTDTVQLTSYIVNDTFLFSLPLNIAFYVHAVLPNECKLSLAQQQLFSPECSEDSGSVP